MKIINPIILIVLALLIWFLMFLIPEFESVQVDPMGDGQSGIGKAVMGLMIMGTGVLAFLIFITFLFKVYKAENTSTLSVINLIASLMISVFTAWYIYS